MCWSILVLLEWKSAMAANDDLIQRLRELSRNIAMIKISAGQCARELDLLMEMVKSIDRHTSHRYFIDARFVTLENVHF